MSIYTEIQKLQPSAIIELFEVDLTAIGGDVYYFHGGTNQLGQQLVWQGNTYRPWPMSGSGFDYNGNGQLPRPKILLSNVNGLITALILDFNDLIGAKFTRRRTLLKFLDAVNFPGGVNPTADPDAHFSDEIYFIDRKAREDKNAVEFELTAAFDVSGVQLPRRQVIQSLCTWKYRGAECGYAGTNYFKADDSETLLQSQDVCGKRVSSCKVRFGANNTLPYGGFPGAGLVG
jgi:lambda family phage minor tail protein L